MQKRLPVVPNGQSSFEDLFCGDQVVVHRLTAVQQVHVGLGADVCEDIRRLLGMALADVGAVVDGDVFLALIPDFFSQGPQKHPDVLAGAEEGASVEGQVVTLVDVVAVKVGIPGGICDLHGVHGSEGLAHGRRICLFLSLGVEAQHGGDALGHGLGGNDHHVLLRGLNAVYGVSEDRGYFYTRAVSLFYTFLLLLVILLTLALHVFGNTILSALSMVDNGILIFLLDIIDLRFALLLIVQSLIFTLMFMTLPNKRNRFWDSFPGGVLSSMGWLIFSDLYSIYVEHFSHYANVYGSIYAVALSMLWLYFCMIILFFGGALNRMLAEWN